MNGEQRPGRSILLLSGGLDSTTMLALATREGFEVHALTFRYGQRHALEVEMARSSAAKYRVASHRIIDIDLRTFGHSALTSDEIQVPLGRAMEEIAGGIPVTYVPARNTIFLAYALAAAEVAGADDIFIGVNAVDYSGYPDCRPEYVRAFEALAALATKAAVESEQRIRIRTPLLHLSKKEIIALGNDLGVDYSMTISCYNPGDSGAACGLCDACQLRLRGFREQGASDPAPYSTLSSV
jgi:7-cyano-7-deazaguanine synthase